MVESIHSFGSVLPHSELRALMVKTKEPVEEVELEIVAEHEHKGWLFMLLEDGTVAIQPNNDQVHALTAGAWQDALSALQASPVVEATYPDTREALVWALRKLTHPAEQEDFCNTHGRVPVTHSCAYHENAEYVRAKMAAGDQS